MVAVRGTLRLLGWCVALAVTLWILHGLSVPADAVDLSSRDPADLLPLLLRGARFLALVCAWYLAGATVLSSLSTLVAWRPLGRLEAAVSVPALRSLARAGLGASLAVGLGLGPAATAAATGPPGASAEPAPLAELDDRPVEGPTPERASEPPAAPVLAPVPAEAPGTTATAAADEASDAAPDGDRDAGSTHEVVAGESFWSIAADLTATELGREPDDAEVVERWLPLIEANRDRLLVPGDPDLLLPGQRLRLPGPPT